MARSYVSGKAFGAVAGRFGMQVSGTVRLIANIEKKLRQTESAIYTQMMGSLLELEAEAIRLISYGYYQPAIDTGRMKNSITHRITELGATVEGEVGTSVYYAIYVHEGTRQKYGMQGTEEGGGYFNPGLGSKGWHMPPRPFLTDAFKNKEKSIRARMRWAFRKEMAGLK